MKSPTKYFQRSYCYRRINKEHKRCLNTYMAKSLTKSTNNHMITQYNYDITKETTVLDLPLPAASVAVFEAATTATG